jgi:hypothetical protein
MEFVANSLWNRFRPDAFRNDIPSILALLWLLIAIGLVSLLIPSMAQGITNGWAAALTVLGSGLFLAGASTVTGSLAGFLFGVPRYRRVDHDAPTTGHGTSSHSATAHSTTAPNTNLEQISDWLTKIIVGVGLTQLPAIGRFFVSLGDQWGSAFGAGASGRLIAISITIHYLIMGFFQGFLLSSLWMPGAVDRAQQRSRGVARQQDSGGDEWTAS